MRKIKISEQNSNWELLGRSPQEDVSSEVFASIAARFPSYVTSYNNIELERPLDHPESTELLKFLENLGVTIPAHLGESGKQIRINDFPVYSSSDIDAAQLMECELIEPRYFNCDLVADEDRKEFVYFKNDKCLQQNKNRKFGSVPNLPHLIIVNQANKEVLENSGLTGLKLIALKLEEEGKKWPEGIPTLYLIWSDYVLPPVNQQLFDNDGNVFWSSEFDYSELKHHCYLIDGYAVRPQLNYKRLPSDSFDIGVSHEWLGRSPCYRKLVYSQKARRVLESMGMILEIRPVKITNR